MYVYLIQSGKKKSDPVKVGYSKNPEARIKTLQTGNPKLLRLLMKIKCNNDAHARRLERTLHEMLKGQNVLLEWFKLNRCNVMKMLNAFANNEGFHQVEDMEGIFSYEELSTKDKIAKATKGRDKNIKEMELCIKRRKLECGIMYRLLSERGLHTKDTKDIINSELGTRECFANQRT